MLGNLYLYTQGSQTIQEALTKLKRGMALGTGLGVNLGNPLESKTNTTRGNAAAAAIPFMMTGDKSGNFSSDTMVNENIKKVKDTIKQDNKEILDRIERVAVTFESLVKTDHLDQEIEVEIEIIEIVEEIVVIDIVEVQVDLLIEVVMIEEVIPPIEVIQEIDIIIIVTGMTEEIDIVHQDHLTIIQDDIEVEIIQDQDIQEIDNHLKSVLFVEEMDTLLKFVGISKNI